MNHFGRDGGRKIIILIFQVVQNLEKIQIVGKMLLVDLFQIWIFIWNLMIDGPTGVIWLIQTMNMNKQVIRWV